MKEPVIIPILYCLIVALACSCAVQPLPSTQPSIENASLPSCSVPSTVLSQPATIPPTVQTEPSVPSFTEPALSAEECAYAEAELLLSEGKNAEAAITFGKLASYADARERSLALWRTVVKPRTIAMSSYHNFALTNSGAILCAGGVYLEGDGGLMEYMCVTEATQWQDIVSIDAEFLHVIGLHADGTVSVRCDDHTCTGTENWTDIVAVAAGVSYFVGLKIDGTVVFSDDFLPSNAVAAWKNIVSIDAGGHNTVMALDINGTVFSSGYVFSEEDTAKSWQNVSTIRCNGIAATGLRADRTVIYIGSNELYQTGVCGWKDMVDVWLTDYGPIGLRTDGTLAWFQQDSLNDLEEWTNIVDICSDSQRIIALCSDGTFVMCGSYNSELEYSKNWCSIQIP